MKILVLPSKHKVLLDDFDYRHVIDAGPWSLKTSKSGSMYAKRNVYIGDKRTTQTMHAFLLEENIDHIDGNGLNNQRHNLRKATKSQNAHNRRGVLGAYFDKKQNKWRVDIVKQGKTYYIGRYANKEEAILAYKAAAKDLFGEFASRDEGMEAPIVK